MKKVFVLDNFEDFEDFKNFDKVKKFINGVCGEFEFELNETQKNLKENPLYHRERTLSSFLFPALLKNSTGALMEVYYNNGEQHHADFYALDKSKECSYLIEFKHMFSNGDKNTIRQKEIERWETVNKQIKNLTSKSVKNWIDGDKSIYGLSFYMLTVETSKNIRIVDAFKNTEKKLLDNFGEDSKNNCHWIRIYQLPENLQFQDPDDNENDKKMYSHIVFMGRIKRIVKG